MIYICVARSDYFHGQYVPFEKVTHNWETGGTYTKFYYHFSKQKVLHIDIFDIFMQPPV